MKKWGRKISLIISIFVLAYTFSTNVVYANTTMVSANDIVNVDDEKLDETENKKVYIGENYKIEYVITNKWESGYVANINIYNTGDQNIENWGIFCKSSCIFSDIWNAKIEKQEQNYQIIRNVEWNQDIAVGKSVSFGYTSELPFCQFPDEMFLIGVLEQCVEDSYEISYKISSMWDNGFNGNIIITNTSEKTIEDWILSFDFENKINNIWNATIQKYEDFHYEISNAKYNQNIKKGESIEIGFTVNDGNCKNVPYNFVLSKMNLSVSGKIDSDGDGLWDEIEKELGTNIYNQDTDGDGINDPYEYLILGTNPLKKDTDDNGIDDGEEDLDVDGLTNKEEFNYGTDPWLADTDQDGLSDYDEIHIYMTNPLVADTDKDGLNDLDDILLGFNPLDPDSNNNSVLDGDEKINQQKSVSINEIEKAAVYRISVDMEISGNIDKEVQIDNMYNRDILSSDVVGLVSVPVSIETNKSFDSAQITFYYNENYLNGINEDNLAVMWYDESNNWYQILDQDSVIDTENNTVSYKTTHFSTYMLVDKEQWYEAWKEDISYRSDKNGEATNYDVAFVVDCSGSMAGNSITYARQALNGFIETLNINDNACLVSFNNYANTVAKFGTSISYIKSKIKWLTASGGTNVDAGIRAGINEFQKISSDNSKIMILICDGDVNYYWPTISLAKKNGIKIYTVNVGYASASGYLKKIAEETGGEYYYCINSSQIEDMFGKIKNETIDYIDTTDTDGDGLYDIYEKTGFVMANGRKILSDPYKQYTDDDKLTDYEEVGIVYNINHSESVLRYIGKGEKKYVPYIMPYSDPRKKDTDGDGLDDDIDPYPWSRECDETNGVSAHRKLDDKGDYYICSKCGKIIKKPATQDKEIMNQEDYMTIQTCAVMFAYYTELVEEVYDSSNYMGLNQKLLVNKISEIRNKYKGKYEYADENGNCISPYFPVSSEAFCFVDVKKMNKINYLSYKGTTATVASLWGGLIDPTAGFLVGAIGTVGLSDYGEAEKVILRPIDLANIVFSTFVYINSTKEIKFAMSCFAEVTSGITVINDTINSEVSLDDYEISICLHRYGSGGLARQSHGTFVTSPEGLVKWHQYIEYGNQNKEDVLK